MITLGERPFHIMMGVLVLLSLLLDPVASSMLPTWDTPEVNLLTLGIGLIWIGLFAAYRAQRVADQQRVLKDRIERSERKISALEAELTERTRPLI